MPENISPSPSVSRRTTLKLAAASALLTMTSAQSANPENKPLIRRKIPRGNNETLPAVGLGTYQTFDVGANAPERTELKQVLTEAAAIANSAGDKKDLVMIDSSPMYGEAEHVVGDLTAELKNREHFFFATKVWTRGRDAGIREMDRSFKLMRTTRMDLMQVHNLLDLAVHDKTLREWKTAGKIRYLGITHYHAGAHAELENIIKTNTYDFVQFNYSMAEREAEARLLPACADSGTAVVINRPFAQANLFGRVKGKPLPPWAAEFDCSSWAQFFLKYLIAHPAVTCVIPGTRRVNHLRDNVQAGMGRLPDAAMRKKMLEHFASL